MDDKFEEFFKKVQKNKDFMTYAGDDLSMGSVVPYGVSSGIPELDLYLGRKGGLPAGKVIEYYGFSMVGKTTAALQAAAEWQKRGGLVIFIDNEQSYSPERFRQLGGVPENLLKHEVNTIEQTFDVIYYYLGTIEGKASKKAQRGLLDDFDKPVLIIVDSVTGVPTQADTEGNLEKSERPGFEAKQIKRGVKGMNPLLSQTKCRPSIIFINHCHETFNSWGKKSKSSGGNGLKYYSSVRVEFTHLGMLTNKSTEQRLGQKIKIYIEKLKGAALEYDKFNTELTNDIGFDRYEGLKLAMIATNFATRPSGSQVVTILPDTDLEVQVKQTEFRRWVEENEGYDTVYKNWRLWAIREGYLSPWGGADS